MGTSDQDWKEFSRWSKHQVIQSRGFRRGQDKKLEAILLQQWNDVSDKQEYLRCIRQHEQREIHTARIRRDNDPNVGVHGRIVRRARSRAIAIASKSYCESLQRMQRMEKRRGKSGKSITFTTIVRYQSRLLKELRNEIRESKEVALREAVDEMCAAFPGIPDDAKEYVTLSYQELPWEDIQDGDVTDREVTVHLRSDLLASQDYRDLETMDWSLKSLATEILGTSRLAGRVRCDGHDLQQQDEDKEPFQRSYMSNEWREYLSAFSRIRLRDRPVPRWTIQAAKTRAEMLWDHAGISIYPPEPDHSDLDLTLDQLSNAEDQYYNDRETKLWHVKIEYAVAEHLDERAHRPDRLSSSAETSRPLYSETANMLRAGRRALQHAWESELWGMIQTQKSPAGEVRAKYALYKKALGVFDADPLSTNRERQWLSPEYTALLKSL